MWCYDSYDTGTCEGVGGRVEVEVEVVLNGNVCNTTFVAYDLLNASA